jgi:hypothetical protein
MSIEYPTNLDNLTNPVGTDKVSVVDHALQHSNANDAIEALQAKVGKNGSAVTTTVDYKLSSIPTNDKAASITGTETLTNKTLTSPTVTNKSSTGTDSGTETLENKTLNTATLNSPVLVTPKITTSINDANGNEVIRVPATTSAVNDITVTNAATGNDPLITPSGDDTDVGIKIKGKGTGKVKLGDAELQVPDVDGTAGQLLITNGSGVLSFISAEGVPDASETVAGVVEEATDAEVTAGTATGATGAKLFVTPAKLATNLATKIPVVRSYAYAASPATWTKPTGLSFIEIELWAAGGSGGRGNQGSGGGGGAYYSTIIPASKLGATETITIGAGGTSRANDGEGVAGGNTSFGTLAYAYGGAKGRQGGGGGGGGIMGAGGDGSSATGGDGGLPIGGNATIPNSIYGGGKAANVNSGAAGSAGGYSVFGGGGAGSGNDDTSGNGGAGGSSIKGGGGGGGAAGSSSGTGGSGGTSLEGGAGGAGSTGGGNGGNGVVPAGGGGGSQAGTTGTGGNGQARVTEYYS